MNLILKIGANRYCFFSFSFSNGFYRLNLLLFLFDGLNRCNGVLLSAASKKKGQ